MDQKTSHDAPCGGGIDSNRRNTSPLGRSDNLKALSNTPPTAEGCSALSASGLAIWSLTKPSQSDTPMRTVLPSGAPRRWLVGAEADVECEGKRPEAGSEEHDDAPRHATRCFRDQRAARYPA